MDGQQSPVRYQGETITRTTHQADEVFLLFSPCVTDRLKIAHICIVCFCWCTVSMFQLHWELMHRVWGLVPSKNGMRCKRLGAHFVFSLIDKNIFSCLQDWYREQEPDADDKGFFNTALPVILFQMIEQNVSSDYRAVDRHSGRTSVIFSCANVPVARRAGDDTEMVRFKSHHLVFGGAQQMLVEQRQSPKPTHIRRQLGNLEFWRRKWESCGMCWNVSHVLIHTQAEFRK